MQKEIVTQKDRHKEREGGGREAKGENNETEDFRGREKGDALQREGKHSKFLNLQIAT